MPVLDWRKDCFREPGGPSEVLFFLLLSNCIALCGMVLLSVLPSTFVVVREVSKRGFGSMCSLISCTSIEVLRLITFGNCFILNWLILVVRRKDEKRCGTAYKLSSFPLLSKRKRNLEAYTIRRNRESHAIQQITGRNRRK